MRRWIDQTANPARARLGLLHSPARRNARRSGRRTDAPASPSGLIGEQLDALVDLLRESARLPEMPSDISDRQSAWHRPRDRGSDAASARRAGRLLRGGRSVGGRSCFWPCEGGLDELSGVFAGRLNASSRASSAAMRASCVAIRSCAAASSAARARISASLLGVRQLAEVGRQDHPAFRIDSIVIVSRISCAGPHASLTVEPITCSKAAVITLGEQIRIYRSAKANHRHGGPSWITKTLSG